MKVWFYCHYSGEILSGKQMISPGKPIVRVGDQNRHVEDVDIYDSKEEAVTKIKAKAQLDLERAQKILDNLKKYDTNQMD